MSQRRTGCLFCFVDGSLPKKSREHLLSRPVANAFGIDRAAGFLRMNEDGSDHRLGVVGGLSRHVVCEPCNNGWMNRLEDRMAALAVWLDAGDAPLGDERALAVRSWALKTHLILCYLAGNADKVGQDAVEWAVLPNFTLARQLYEGDTEAIGALAVGLARAEGVARFTYAFGNPTVIPTGENHVARTAAIASIVTLGSLQVWIATSLRAMNVDAPVAPVTPDLRANQLALRPVLGDLDAIVVDHGEHDLAAEMKALHEWAAAEDARRATEPPT